VLLVLLSKTGSFNFFLESTIGTSSLFKLVMEIPTIAVKESASGCRGCQLERHEGVLHSEFFSIFFSGQGGGFVSCSPKYIIKKKKFSAFLNLKQSFQIFVSAVNVRI
jgi:hypothetical protein